MNPKNKKEPFRLCDKYLKPLWKGLLFFCMGFLLSHSQAVYGQTDRLQVAAGVGHILDIFPNFPETHTSFTAQFDWLASNRGIADEGHYLKPEYGLSLNYGYLDNDEILGRFVGLQGNFQTYHPLGKRSEWTIGFAFGGGYFTESYDYLDNPENIMTGSALSFLATGNMGVRHRLTDALSAIANIKYHHTSNAHLVLPNVGMNMLLLELGVSYDLRNRAMPDVDSTRFHSGSTEKKLRPYTRLFYGINELGETTRPTNGPRYHKAGVAVGLRYLTQAKHGWSVELSGYYDDANFTYLILEEAPNTTRMRGSVFMLMAGHEFLFARFGFVTQLGINLYNPGLQQITDDLPDASLTERLGNRIPGRFCLHFYPLGRTRNAITPMLNIGVKTHLGGADFLETGITLLFGKIH